MRHRLFLLVLASSLVVALTPGTASADPRDLTGDQIHILAGEPTQYPANTEFFVLHGISSSPPGQTRDGFGRHPEGMLFELNVDGIPIEPTFTTTQPWGRDWPGVIAKQWAFNFPEGLDAGDHTFHGLWYVACAWVEGDLVEECDKVTTPVVVIDLSLTVRFYEES